jgi:predicted nuclease with TOPRIM domain
MHAIKVVLLICILLLISELLVSVHAAPIETDTFQGFGIRIDLKYPEEAHPGDSVTLNVSITSGNTATLKNFTAVIKALLNNEYWLEIYNAQDTFVKYLPLTYTLQLSQLPQDAAGKLQCLLYVTTNKNPNDPNIVMINITEVREFTYTELISAYNMLETDFDTLSTQYATLNSNFDTLSTQYATLNSTYNALLTNYALLNASYVTLDSTYNKLNADFEILNSTYNSILAEFNILNSSYNTLQAEKTSLQSNLNALNQNYSTLQATHNSLLISNNNLQKDYDTLNTNNIELRTLYNTLVEANKTLQDKYDSLSVNSSLLRDAYNMLNGNYTYLKTQMDSLLQQLADAEDSSNNSLNLDRAVMSMFLVAVAGLIAFIIYLKRKETEPYIVVRKETVAIENDEKQKQQ